jgi:cytochrome c-type biogenesis protein CcmE
MKARQKRFALVVGGVAVLGLAAWLVLSAFQQNLVFFYSPTDILEGKAPQGRNFRIGGMVEVGSIKRQEDGLTVGFVVTDTAKSIPVHYKGILPDLFKEGKGVVAQGKLNANGLFVAEEVLAKHDENYMPPEAQAAVDKANQARDRAQKTMGAPANPGAAK